MSEEFTLGPKSYLAGYRVNSYDSVTSTNELAMQSAKDTTPIASIANTWFVAHHQTAGRGRRGREWQSHEGNLAASLVVVLPSDTPAPALLGFVAGNALAKSAIQSLGEQGKDITIKWPNDLLLSGAKLAGILLESERLISGESVVIVGMGLNVKNAPDGLAYSTACLSDIDPTVTAADVFTKLSENWLECFDQWDFGAGRQDVLAQWRELAGGIGRPIRIVRSNDTLEGVFETIDEHGHLIVKTPSGTYERVTTGDVQF